MGKPDYIVGAARVASFPPSSTVYYIRCGVCAGVHAAPRCSVEREQERAGAYRSAQIRSSHWLLSVDEAGDELRLRITKEEYDSFKYIHNSEGLKQKPDAIHPTCEGGDST